MVQGEWMTDAVRRARINRTMLKTEGTGWDVGYGETWLAI